MSALFQLIIFSSTILTCFNRRSTKQLHIQVPFLEDLSQIKDFFSSFPYFNCYDCQHVVWGDPMTMILIVGIIVKRIIVKLKEPQFPGNSHI